MSEIQRVTCCECRCEILLRADHIAALKENHNLFHCHMGHPQSFRGRSEADVLRDQLATAKRQRDENLDRALRAERERQLDQNKCQHCKRRFETPKKLAGHLDRVHGVRSKPRALPADAGRS
jgi:hypothetical protein